MGRDPGLPEGAAPPFTVDWGNVALFAAVIVIAILWWRLYGAEFMLHRFRFCMGCRRDAACCSCPPEVTFTGWDDLSDEERDDGI